MPNILLQTTIPIIIIKCQLSTANFIAYFLNESTSKLKETGGNANSWLKFLCPKNGRWSNDHHHLNQQADVKIQP